VDGSGHPVAIHATSPGMDRRVMERIRELTASELVSAERGQRPARGEAMDLLAALALQDWTTAERLVRDNPRLLERGRAPGGILHLMSKRGDTAGATWLLDHGADPNALWPHWDAEVTPLHLAAMQNQANVARLLLDRGADATVRDSKHDADALGWAEFFEHQDVVRVIKAPRT
jgi:hypothetical protein